MSLRHALFGFRPDVGHKNMSILVENFIIMDMYFYKNRHIFIFYNDDAVMQ